METDSAGNPYKDIVLPDGHGWHNTSSIRIQIRDDNGHLRQGPEVPVESIGDMVGAIVELLTSRI